MKTVPILFRVLCAVLVMGCSPQEDRPSHTPSGSAAEAMPATRPAFSLIERGELLPVGAVAPDFELLDHLGRPFRLSAHRGRPVVLVFYPKDFTPGCTKQLCAIRDDWSQFEAKNLVVAGVNPGPVEEHRRFAEDHAFPFPVLCDPDQRVAGAYGCKGASGLPSRTVYVIDADGRIAMARSGMPANSEILASVAR